MENWIEDLISIKFGNFGYVPGYNIIICLNCSYIASITYGGCYYCDYGSFDGACNEGDGNCWHFTLYCKICGNRYETPHAGFHDRDPLLQQIIYPPTIRKIDHVIYEVNGFIKILEYETAIIKTELQKEQARKTRICLKCGNPIVGKRKNAIYCKSCSDEIRLEGWLQYGR